MAPPCVMLGNPAMCSAGVNRACKESAESAAWCTSIWRPCEFSRPQPKQVFLASNSRLRGVCMTRSRESKVGAGCDSQVQGRATSALAALHSFDNSFDQPDDPQQPD